MKQIDTKLIIWVITLIFLAGGAWWSLSDVSADVAKIQETLDGQESELTIHVASDGHIAGESRIEKIEASQDARPPGPAVDETASTGLRCVPWTRCVHQGPVQPEHHRNP